MSIGLSTFLALATSQSLQVLGFKYWKPVYTPYLFCSHTRLGKISAFWCTSSYILVLPQVLNQIELELLSFDIALDTTVTGPILIRLHKSTCGTFGCCETRTDYSIYRGEGLNRYHHQQRTSAATWREERAGF